jgi:lipopolysaccharide transport system permease protein
MVGVIDGFRWALLGEPHTIDAAGCAMSVLAAGALLASGFQYFRRTERFFADLI